MLNSYSMPLVSSPYAATPYALPSQKGYASAPSYYSASANSTTKFDYTNYAPSFADKSRTNILTDNSQANPTNNLQLNYMVKAPQKTNIYYDGQSHLINNNYNTYYYVAPATPPQQPSYEPQQYYPTPGDGYKKTGSYYPKDGGYSGGYAPAGYSGYGYPSQQQDNNWMNIILSVLLPLLQRKQDHNYNRTPDINVTIKNELKDLVNLVNENKTTVLAKSDSVIDHSDSDYAFDIDQSQHETTSYYEAEEEVHPKAKKTHLSESGPSKKSTASKKPLW